MRFYKLRQYLPTWLEHLAHSLREPQHTLAGIRKRREARRLGLEYPHPILFIAGLPKSGTTWVENFLYHVPAYLPCRIGGEISVQIQQNLPSTAFSRFPQNGYSFVKTHTNPELENFSVIAQAGIERILILVRDPADVAVSRYHYLLANPKGRGEPEFIDYRGMDEGDGLRHSLEVVGRDYLAWIRGWHERSLAYPEQHLLVRYEDLRESTEETFAKICQFFELGLDTREIKGILTTVDTQMKSRALQASGSAGVKSTFRKGQRGEGKQIFPEALLKTFYDAERATLESLGYAGKSLGYAGKSLGYAGNSLGNAGKSLSNAGQSSVRTNERS